MAKEILNEEELNFVSGGLLLEGWDETLLTVMRIYKGRYGDEGYDKVRDMVLISINDPTSPVTEEDAETLYQFIDDNWESVIPWEF